MSTYVDGRKGLVAVIMVICVLLAPHSTSAVAGAVSGSAASQSAACGPSMQGVDRSRADLGLDNALANRTNALAASARRAGQPPPANEIQSLTEDSLDGLNDAGDQLDQAAGEINKQLESMNLPRQQRAWTQGIDKMKSARTNLNTTLRQDPVARCQRIGSLSPTGVGPKVMYDAAGNYQSAVDGLNAIADQGGFVELGQKNWIAQGKPDTPPPPNPGPDPWLEWLKRLQAQQARIRSNIHGLNAARALQAGQLQQAQQNATDMRQAVQDIQNLANQLGQLASLCNQAVSNRQQPQSSQASGGGAAAGASAGGGGAGGAVLLGLGLVGAGVGGYALYKASQCPVPPVTSDYSACASGNCNVCVRMSREVATYCDCFEAKGQTPSGNYCSELRRAIDDLAAACMVPKAYTPLPRPIAR